MFLCSFGLHAARPTIVDDHCLYYVRHASHRQSSVGSSIQSNCRIKFQVLTKAIHSLFLSLFVFAIRVVHYKDIVPHLPPLTPGGFWHVMTEIWEQVLCCCLVTLENFESYISLSAVSRMETSLILIFRVESDRLRLT
jgi:hypothetical protein